MIIEHLDNKLIIKAGKTNTEPETEEAVSDRNICLILHKVGSRVVRYEISYRKPKGAPRFVSGGFYTTFHYGALKHITTERKRISVLYHDNYMRLFSFGENYKSMDYMVVVRR